MKKISVSLLLFFGLLSFLQSQNVDSIKVEQTGEMIKIHYKILNSNSYQLFRVTVFCSINGGLKSELKSLSGDFGENVVGGRTEYMVLWDVLKDVEEVRSVDFSVRAELIRDDSPKIIDKTQSDWKNKRFYVLPTMHEGKGVLYGIRLAYMGSFGVSWKIVTGKIEQYNSSGISDFHTSLDLTKRVINNKGFQFHIMAGIAVGKLELDIPENAFANFPGYEVGAILAIRRVALSYGFNHYSDKSKPENIPSRTNFQNFGIGVRF